MSSRRRITRTPRRRLLWGALALLAVFVVALALPSSPGGVPPPADAPPAGGDPAGTAGVATTGNSALLTLSGTWGDATLSHAALVPAGCEATATLALSAAVPALVTLDYLAPGATVPVPLGEVAGDPNGGGTTGVGDFPGGGDPPGGTPPGPAPGNVFAVPPTDTIGQFTFLVTVSMPSDVSPPEVVAAGESSGESIVLAVSVPELVADPDVAQAFSVAIQGTAAPLSLSFALAPHPDGTPFAILLGDGVESLTVSVQGAADVAVVCLAAGTEQVTLSFDVWPDILTFPLVCQEPPPPEDTNPLPPPECGGMWIEGISFDVFPGQSIRDSLGLRLNGKKNKGDWYDNHKLDGTLHKSKHTKWAWDPVRESDKKEERDWINWKNLKHSARFDDSIAAYHTWVEPQFKLRARLYIDEKLCQVLGGGVVTIPVRATSPALAQVDEQSVTFDCTKPEGAKIYNTAPNRGTEDNRFVELIATFTVPPNQIDLFDWTLTWQFFVKCPGDAAAKWYAIKMDVPGMGPKAAVTKHRVFTTLRPPKEPWKDGKAGVKALKAAYNCTIWRDVLERACRKPPAADAGGAGGAADDVEACKRLEKWIHELDLGGPRYNADQDHQYVRAGQHLGYRNKDGSSLRPLHGPADFDLEKVYFNTLFPAFTMSERIQFACFDLSSLMALVSRSLGIEAYPRTIFTFPTPQTRVTGLGKLGDVNQGQPRNPNFRIAAHAFAILLRLDAVLEARGVLPPRHVREAFRCQTEFLAIVAELRRIAEQARINPVLIEQQVKLLEQLLQDPKNPKKPARGFRKAIDAVEKLLKGASADKIEATLGLLARWFERCEAWLAASRLRARLVESWLVAESASFKQTGYVKAIEAKLRDITTGTQAYKDDEDALKGAQNQTVECRRRLFPLVVVLKQAEVRLKALKASGAPKDEIKAAEAARNAANKAVREKERDCRKAEESLRSARRAKTVNFFRFAMPNKALDPLLRHNVAGHGLLLVGTDENFSDVGYVNHVEQLAPRFKSAWQRRITVAGLLWELGIKGICPVGR